MLLLVFLPVVSCLVPKFVGQAHPRRLGSFSAGGNKVPSVGALGGGRTRSRGTALNLAVDPADAAQHAASAATAMGSLLSQSPAGADAGTVVGTTYSAFDLLSTDLLSTMISAKVTVVPNQSLIPLPDTVRSLADTVIPDLPTMPGGVPRHASPFLSESFRDIFNAPLRAPAGQKNWGDLSSGTTVELTAREWDFAGRYADLMNRIPLAAAVYAFVDFFLINAEEDVYLGELIDDEEAEAILEVESSAVSTRLVGLFMMVVATVLISVLTYHPVPFGELGL